MENHVVHKSNDLVEAKFKLPLIEQRILAICISKINPTKMRLENPYRFNFQEYCDLAGCSLENMEDELRAAVRNLKSRVLEKRDDVRKKTRFYSWTSKIDVWDAMSFDLYFDDELEVDLLAKVRYTSYLLKSAFNLNSKYSLRLYEIAKEKRGLTHPPKFAVDHLRILLGVEEGEYSRYQNFKARCLTPAIIEVNENTDLHLAINEFRQARQVYMIELIIEDNILPPKPSKLKELKKLEATKPSNQPDIFELMPPSDYSADLIADLDAKGILHLHKYEAEGILESHWRQALASETEPAKIITTARTLAKMVAATTTKAIESKKQTVSIEANRQWWNANYRALLLEPFWHGDRPLFMKNPPSSVEVESFCWVGLEAVNFGRPDFQEYILGKVKQFEDKLNERTRK